MVVKKFAQLRFADYNKNLTTVYINILREGDVDRETKYQEHVGDKDDCVEKVN